MSGSIQLHPKLGVNARLTFCPRCGGDGPGLVMMGIRNYKDTCVMCGMIHYGGANKRVGHCDRCDCDTRRVQLMEGEKVLGEMCEACAKEVALEHKHLEEGAVAFRCRCGARGIIKAESELAKMTRKAHTEQAKKEGGNRDYCAGPPFLACGVGLDVCPNCEKKQAPETIATN